MHVHADTRLKSRLAVLQTDEEVNGHISDATLRPAVLALGLKCANPTVWPTAIHRSAVAVEVAEAILPKLVYVVSPAVRRRCCSAYCVAPLLCEALAALGLCVGSDAPHAVCGGWC